MTDTPTVTQEQMDQVENTCNELIRENVAVVVHNLDENTPEEELENVILFLLMNTYMWPKTIFSSAV